MILMGGGGIVGIGVDSLQALEDRGQGLRRLFWHLGSWSEAELRSRRKCSMTA